MVSAPSSRRTLREDAESENLAREVQRVVVGAVGLAITSVRLAQRKASAIEGARGDYELVER